MSYFRRGDPDRRPNVPRPWTSSTPPKPHSRRLLDRPTCIGIIVILIGLWVAARMPDVKWVGLSLVGLAMAGLVWYATEDLRRWFDERRWRNSPGPTDTLDDL